MTVLRQHSYLAALFVCFSIADLALTSYLLRLPTGEVYEANWLAREVLASWGLAGLAAFKGLVVLVAGGLLMVVATYRPRAARRLITFACAAVGSVVLYSLGLLFHLEQSAGAERGQDLATVTRVKQNLEQ
ncbi:MAG TPA: DUF5658 family protein, partial [Gemmataceae bacterium]|nr:DUF5658 family protein [Gemmataceae bacterium]